MKEKKKTSETVKEIVKELEEGLKELKESDRFKDFLKCMSKFHNYSINNSILIMLQRPDASYVAGFNTWKNSFHRNVKKGEKGIRILAPAPVKKIETEEVTDENGNIKTKEVEHTLRFFKPAYVFDISQTEGEPLKENPAQMLKEDVNDYETLKDAVISISRVPVRKEKLEGKNGYFSPNEQRIVINEGMSESQTIKTLLHEIAHSRLHDPNNKDTKKKDRNTKEVEAESVAFTVSNYFGINTDSYSFGYILGWSKSLELKEFKDSLETIRQTSSSMIDDLSKALISQKEKNKISIKKRLTEANKTVKEQPETQTKKKEALLA